MSEENVEIVRGLHEAFDQIGMEVVRDALLQGAILRRHLRRSGDFGLSVDDDVEVKLVASSFSLPDMPAGTTLHGPEGWLTFWRGWLEPWESFEYEFGNFADAGDDVVMDNGPSARGRRALDFLFRLPT